MADAGSVSDTADGAPHRPHLVFLVTEDWYFCTHRLALAAAAVRAGFRVTVVTRVGAHHEQMRAAGLEVVHFELTRKGLNLLREVPALARLTGLYRRLAPDMVHHVALKPVVYGTLAARLAGVPGVVNAVAGLGFAFTAGGGLARVLKTALRFVLPRLLNTGQVIVQNPDDREQLVRHGVAPARITLIRGAGVDLQAFAAAPQPDGPVTVMLASRMIRAKGVDAFVDAARALRTAGTGARFVLVGRPDPGNPDSLDEAELAAWHAGGVVEWWGHRADMAAVLGAAHVVCLPSSYGEGLPKVLIEAAAIGRAIVATDIPGCREVVRDGDNGLLVPAGDGAALAAAIGALVADPARRAAMGRRGRARAEAELGDTGVIDATLAVYRELPSR